MLRQLAHFSVRVSDLEASIAFYMQALGLKIGPRPPFDFPGAWLYFDSDTDVASQGCVHLIGPDPTGASSRYLGLRRPGPGTSTGALDHIAFLAQDWRADQARIAASGIAYSERSVPQLQLRQVFMTDPDCVTIELNYAD